MRRRVPGRLHLRRPAKELHQPDRVHRLRRVRDRVSPGCDLPGAQGPRDEERQQFTTDNAEFFTVRLEGLDEPLGDPGGAQQLGPVAADTPLVAGWPKK